MDEHEVPETVDETVGGEAAQPEAAHPEETDLTEGDAVLDGFEADLNNVAAALDALDVDDLGAAEALVSDLAETEPSTAAEPS